MKIELIMMAILLFPVSLYAYCEGGKYPNISVSDEIKQCEFIIVGTVTARNIVVDPIKDPEGYEAEIFHVNVEEILHGHPRQGLIKPYLSVYNANGSSRFPMNVGERYLLFVYSGNHGFWINICGNSSTYENGRKRIDELRKTIDKRRSK